MHLTKDQAGAVLTSGRGEDQKPTPAPKSSVSIGKDDPEARQFRKLALMAALSEGLPTLPAYVFELNGLLATTPVDLNRVADVIRTDPSLTAQVLRMSNSRRADRREGVTKIHKAVNLVGTERLRTMVLTCSLVEYAGHRLVLEDLQSFWQHCFLTAALSERLARGIGFPQPEQAYLAGLLHDIGVLPLLVANAAGSQKVGRGSTCGWGESLELERECFGTDHCEVGHWIGVSWNFPPDLVDVMARHHRTGEATLEPQLMGLVAAADQYCVQRGIGVGAVARELSVAPGAHAQDTLRTFMPALKPEEADRLAAMVETDFFHLTQLMEFGAAGLFGGGIPKNPFWECEG